MTGTGCLTARWPIRLLLLPCALLLSALAGCVTGPAGGDLGPEPPPPAIRKCCANVERYPDWLVAVLDPVAPVIGRVVAAVEWRDGHLYGRDGAVRLLRRHLRPLDIVLVTSGGRLTNATLPGLFKHVAIYLGSDADMRRLGVWSDAVTQEQAADILAGRTFIEADQDGVHLSSAETVLNADYLVVLRPALAARAERRRAMRFLLGAVGQPFDFRFDADTADCFFCSELVRRALPSLPVEARHIYGRHVFVPDQFADLAAARPSRLRPVLYLVGHRDEWGTRSPTRLRGDLARYWAAQP